MMSMNMIKVIRLSVRLGVSMNMDIIVNKFNMNLKLF